MPDENRTLAEDEAPEEVDQVSGQVVESAQDGPLTKEMFSAQMQRLTERARAAGLHPIQTLAHTYAKRFVAIIEGLLTALENEDISKKKKN